MSRGLAGVLLLALAACRASAPEPGASARRYTMRGVVVQLPDRGSAHPQVVLRHERIPDFRDASGAVIGMDAMTMPFDLAPAASAPALAVGDQVEAVLAVDWARPSVQIERLSKLPAATTTKGDPP